MRDESACLELRSKAMNVDHGRAVRLCVERYVTSCTDR
jgi:hypothetical protein